MVEIHRENSPQFISRTKLKYHFVNEKHCNEDENWMYFKLYHFQKQLIT